MKDISLAVKHINWSMIGPKEWTNIEWTIYTDLSVDIKLFYNAKDQDQETKCKITEEMYKRLLDQVTLAKENKNKVQLYFKTDHHMTSEGSYLLYLAFCKTANIIPVKLSEFTKETVSTDFLGTFDSKAQVPWQEKDKITVYKNTVNTNVLGNYDGQTYNSIFNPEYLSKKDKYSYFLNGNHAKVVIKTKVNN